MSNPAPQLVQILWNYYNILRDDGLLFEVVLELEEVGATNLQRARRQSILKKAFTGELLQEDYKQ